MHLNDILASWKLNFDIDATRAGFEETVVGRSSNRDPLAYFIDREGEREAVATFDAFEVTSVDLSKGDHGLRIFCEVHFDYMGFRSAA
jgi:hypothetical protein